LHRSAVLCMCFLLRDKPLLYISVFGYGAVFVSNCFCSSISCSSYGIIISVKHPGKYFCLYFIPFNLLMCMHLFTLLVTYRLPAVMHFSRLFVLKALLADQRTFGVQHMWVTERLFTFHMRHSLGEMYIGHSHLCVCLFRAAFPHYCMDTNVTWTNGRGCHIVVHYWADLQSGARPLLLWQHSTELVVLVLAVWLVVSICWHGICCILWTSTSTKWLVRFADHRGTCKSMSGSYWLT